MTYGTDSIRMKLALDNPSDYMHPDRLLPGLPLCSALSNDGSRRFSLAVIISSALDVGWGVGREGPVGPWEKKAYQTDRQTGRTGLVGKEYKCTLCLCLELTLKIIIFGSGSQASNEKRPKMSL